MINENMQLARAYVPFQQWASADILSPEEGLAAGTIFNCLNMPYDYNESYEVFAK